MHPRLFSCVFTAWDAFNKRRNFNFSFFLCLTSLEFKTGHNFFLDSTKQFRTFLCYDSNDEVGTERFSWRMFRQIQDLQLMGYVYTKFSDTTAYSQSNQAFLVGFQLYWDSIYYCYDIHETKAVLYYLSAFNDARAFIINLILFWFFRYFAVCILWIYYTTFFWLFV